MVSTNPCKIDLISLLELVGFQWGSHIELGVGNCLPWILKTGYRCMYNRAVAYSWRKFCQLLDNSESELVNSRQSATC